MGPRPAGSPRGAEVAIPADRRFLRRVEALSGLEDTILEAVAEVAEPRRLAAGKTLFREGEPADSMFIVERGALEVRTVGRGGREVVPRVVRAS